VIAVLAASTGIAPSVLRTEDPEDLDDLVAVVFKGKPEQIEAPDPSGLAARMAGRG
jgi:hypothetical protein